MSSNISETIAQVITALPDHVAISTPDQDLSYRELGHWAASIQQQVAQLATDTEAAVLILSADAMGAAVSMISLMASAKVMVPLDMDQSPHRLSQIVEQVKPQLVLHDTEAARVLDAVPALATVPRLNIQRDQLSITSCGQFQVTPRDPDAPCYIYFTSGSTGQPKGILGRLKGVAHFIDWEVDELQLEEGVRVSQITSPSFDAVLRDLYTPLTLGGTVCVPSSRKIVGDGAAFAAWLGKAHVSVLHCVPSVLRVLLQTIKANGALRPASLQHVCVAGEVLFPADVQVFKETLGDTVSLINLYGPSETTMVKLFHRVDMHADSRVSVPVGKAMPGARALVIDSRDKPCGVGMVGEIYIRTPYRSLGYFNRPDLTAEVFVPNPLSGDPLDLVYRTGDLGRMLDSGDIEFVGRRDRQVKINGVRIELAEIESLIRLAPGVTDVAVVERQLPERTSELVAYIVIAEGADIEQVRSFVLEQGSAVMLPHHLLLMPVLPRTVTGKIDYANLPAVELLASDSDDDGPQPGTPLEIAVAELWQELLEVPELPGIDARFFSKGGHSLLAMQLLSRIEATFGVSVSIRNFLDSPTVRHLAQLVETAFLEASADDDLFALMDEGA